MKKIIPDKSYIKTHNKRYHRTLDFVNSLNIKSLKILDLGPINPLSQLLRDNGYSITNTEEFQDLDNDYGIVQQPEYEVVTAFEILEHLVSPFPMLKSIATNRLVVSVPLSLWFAKAYWSEKDPFDRHYHEFEPRQLHMLLNKAGWKVVKEEKWTSHSFQLGIRPILRMFVPRHYIVYCER